MNFTPSGTKQTENGLFPSNHQFHFTAEVTHGLTPHWELGGYLVTAYVHGIGPKFAGSRIRPRFRIPEGWRLPFRASVSTELGFNKHQFDANTITLECYFSVNPDLTKNISAARMRIAVWLSSPR